MPRLAGASVTSPACDCAVRTPPSTNAAGEVHGPWLACAVVVAAASGALRRARSAAGRDPLLESMPELLLLKRLLRIFQLSFLPSVTMEEDLGVLAVARRGIRSDDVNIASAAIPDEARANDGQDDGCPVSLCRAQASPPPNGLSGAVFGPLQTLVRAGGETSPRWRHAATVGRACADLSGLGMRFRTGGGLLQARPSTKTGRREPTRAGRCALERIGQVDTSRSWRGGLGVQALPGSGPDLLQNLQVDSRDGAGPTWTQPCPKALISNPTDGPSDITVL